MDAFGLTLITAPVLEPVTAADVRTWGRFVSTTTGEYADAVLKDRIKAAREILETYTGSAFVTQTWALSLDAFPGGLASFADGDFCTSGFSAGTIYLPKPPWQSIVSVQYVDFGGTTQTMTPTDYRFDATRGRLTPAYGKVWPVAQYVVGAVTVTFTTGYNTDPNNLPAQIREAVLEVVEDRLKNRGGMYQIPAGTKEKLNALWSGRI